MCKKAYIVSLEVLQPNEGPEPLIVVGVAERVVRRFNKREGLQNLKIRTVTKLIEDQLNSNIAFELFVRLKAVTSVQFTVVKAIVKSQFSS